MQHRVLFLRQSRELSEQVLAANTTLPQGLSPTSFCFIHGTAQAVPFQRKTSARSEVPQKRRARVKLTPRFIKNT
jgi:hypothetical protein